MKYKDKIYIIEDDANILSGLTANLRCLGYEIGCDSGNESMENVLTNLKVHQPNYIILDLILPKIDGFKLLHRIKADEAFCKCPVIVFTDFSESDFKTRSLKIGADYFFVKTDFRIDEFVEKVNKIINNRKKNRVF